METSRQWIAIALLITAALSSPAQESTAILDEYENGNKKYVMVTRKDTNIFKSYYESGRIKYECYGEHTDTFYVKIGKPVVDSVATLVRSCVRYTNWNSSGAMVEQGKMVKGESDGWIKYWSGAGTLIREELYDRGKLLERKEY